MNLTLHTESAPMKKILVVAAALLSLAACSDAADGEAGGTTPATTPATSSAAAAGSTIAVKLAETSLGPVLAGVDGRTLYGFTNDLRGQTTCFGTCAEAWPPVVVGPDWTVGPELDSGVFSTVDRGDGTKQLVAGKWPLYYYSGDAAPGDTNGQASGRVWFAVGADAVLVRDTPEAAGQGDPAAAASVQLGETSFGEVLVDADGQSLYAFTKDVDGTPTCADACADAWPPATTDADLAVGEGLDSAAFSLVPALEGGQQLKAGVWPLYRFAGDEAPGDTNGQGSGGVWFLVDADGKLVK